jgi:protein XagA
VRRSRSSSGGRIVPLFLAGFMSCALLVTGADHARAGAWTRPTRGFYTRVALNHYGSDQRFDEESNRASYPAGASFSDWNGSVYLEYGLTSRLTAIGSFAYKSLRTESDAAILKGWGLGDVDVAARFKILDRPSGVLSLQTLAKIAGPYETDDPLPLGNGQTDFEARILYGRSLWQLFPGYCNFEFGYRWRADDPSDELRYLVEAGSDLGRGFYTRAKLDGIASRENGADLDTTGNPTAQNNYDLGKLDITLGRRMGNRFSIELGVTPDLYGKTTAAGTNVCVGVAYQSR